MIAAGIVAVALVIGQMVLERVEAPAGSEASASIHRFSPQLRTVARIH